jgi:hypothetical protein
LRASESTQSDAKAAAPKTAMATVTAPATARRKAVSGQRRGVGESPRRTGRWQRLLSRRHRPKARRSAWRCAPAAIRFGRGTTASATDASVEPGVAGATRTSGMTTASVGARPMHARGDHDADADPGTELFAG